MGNWAISVGDALSQFLGRFIWVYVDGGWHCWTASPNESISGAAFRWARAGHFKFAEKAINFLFTPFESDHCRKAFIADRIRAQIYIQAAEVIL